MMQRIYADLCCWRSMFYHCFAMVRVLPAHFFPAGNGYLALFEPTIPLIYFDFVA
jgi:hypothetical protein